MKKLLFVAVIGFLVACGETNTEASVDSTVVEAPAVVDSAVVDSAVVDTTAPVVVDTTAAAK